MKTNAIVWAIMVVLLAVGTYLIFGDSTTQAPSVFDSPTTSTTSTSSTSPVEKSNKPPVMVQQAPVVPTAHIDGEPLVANTKYPVITGTANVPKIGIIIYNNDDIAVVGAYDLPVSNGRWTYSPPTALTTGPYTVTVLTGGPIISAKLVIKVP